MISEPEVVEINGASARVYRDAPMWDGQRTAAVGAVVFNTAQAGHTLLNEIAGTLAGEGFQAILGPMDGDTWHSYRLVVESDGSLPFLMEPVSGQFDLEVFEAAGFSTISKYVSARAKLADALGAQPVTLDGVSVSAWDGKHAEQLIGKLFEMSGAAFADNKFFKPINLEEFLEIYRPLLGMIDPSHVLFAHNGGGQLVGFLFGMPDRPAEGMPPTVILKTYASGMRGVGHLLADTYHRQAIDLGFKDIIHALMHEDNVSLERSKRHKAHIFRRYALMGSKL